MTLVSEISMTTEGTAAFGAAELCAAIDRFCSITQRRARSTPYAKSMGSYDCL